MCPCHAVCIFFFIPLFLLPLLLHTITAYPPLPTQTRSFSSCFWSYFTFLPVPRVCSSCCSCRCCRYSCTRLRPINRGIAAPSSVTSGAFSCCDPMYVVARVTRWLISGFLLMMTLLRCTLPWYHGIPTAVGAGAGCFPCCYTAALCFVCARATYDLIAPWVFHVP